jgi:HEAT repeat protein
LWDTSDLLKWCDELDVIALLETNGAFALPVLLEIAKSTNSAIVRAQAANVAGSLEPRPQVAVKLLKQAMDSPDIREMGLYRLRQLGTNASEATETVVVYLADTNARVRWAASNVLRSINPAKAEEIFRK